MPITFRGATGHRLSIRILRFRRSVTSLALSRGFHVTSKPKRITRIA